MRKIRRKVAVRIIERAALTLVLLDAVLYFAVVRPLDKMADSEDREFNAVRRQVHEAGKRVAQLEKFRVSLPEAKEKVQLFEQKYVPPRRRGFSRAARLVRQFTEQSRLELASVAYKLDSAREEPLERLGIEVNVVGPFRSLLMFTHDLETSNDFLVIRSFNFEPAENGVVALRLSADLYLEP